MTACRYDRDRGEYLLPDGEPCEACPFSGCPECRFQTTEETR